MEHHLGYTVLVLVVYVLAVMRVTRLINGDTITDPLRIAVERRKMAAQAAQREASEAGHGAQYLAFEKRATRWDTVSYFLTCPWCVSIWLVAATAWIPPVVTGLPLWWWPLIGLATSHLVGVCARFADTDDVEIVEDHR